MSTTSSMGSDPSASTAPTSTQADFTAADFARELPSPKIGAPLPPAPDNCRLSAPNLMSWLKFVEYTLRGRLLQKHLTCQPLPVTDPHFPAWSAEQYFVHSWLLTHTLSREVYDKFLHLTTPREIWEHARRYCGHDADDWKIFTLAERASVLRHGTMSIMDYSLAHQALWREVDYYMPVGDPNCVDRRHALKLRYMSFLDKLNPEYADVRRRALHSQTPLPDFDGLVKELTEVESSLRRQRPLLDLPAESPGESAALLSRPTEQPPLLPKPSSGSRAPVVCSYCGKPNHLEARCIKKFLDSTRDPEVAPSSSSAPASSSRRSRKARAHLAQAPAPSPSSSSHPAMTNDQLTAELARLSSQLAALQTGSSSQPTVAHFSDFGGEDFAN
ncbi:uncharacterized protein LOC144707885 [Wolffia australiana]